MACSRVRWFFVLLFTTTAVSGSLWGGGIAGVVRDAQSGRLLPGTGVSLVDRTSRERLRSVTTAADGSFLIQDVEAGSYSLVVSRLGYLETVHEVEIPAHEAVEIEVSLAANVVTQTQVVVTATRAESQVNPVTISNLTNQDLEQRGAMQDLPVVLSELPSTTYYSENGNAIGYSTLRLRGFDQRRVAVLVNGVPQNDPEDHNVYWINFFDLQGAIQDIQVQRGAGSSFYGSSGIGGAINIVALPYRSYPYTTLHLGYGSFDTQRYTIETNTGLVNNRYILFGRYSRLVSDGYRDWSWTKFDRFFVGGVWYGKNSTWTLQSYGGPQRDGLAFSGVPKSANHDAAARRFNFSGFTRDVEYFHQPHIELIHDWKFRPNWTLNQTLFWVKGEGSFDFGATFRSAEYLRLPPGFRGLSAEQRRLPLFLTAPDASILYRAYLDQWQIGWMPQVTRKHAGGQTTWGGEIRLHRSLRWGRVQQAQGLPLEVVGPARDFRSYQFHAERVNTAFYVHHLFRPVAWVAVQADAQVSYQHYRHYDERFFANRFRVPYVFVNPRLGVTFNPGRPWSAYASLAVAGREPRLKQIYDGEEAGAGFQPQFQRNSDGSFDFDSPLVKPERLIDFEVGTALSRSHYRLASNLFLMSFRDEIVPSGGLDQFGVPRTGNADRTRHLGVEIEGAALLSARLEVSANLTYSRNRFLRFVEYVTDASGIVRALDRAGNPIAGFPELVANARVAYGWKKMLAAVDAKYAGKQYIDNARGKLPDGRASSDLEVAPYALVNFSATYDMPEDSRLKGVRLSFNINNLLNRKVLLFGNVGPVGAQFFPAATRHVFGSIQYTFH